MDAQIDSSHENATNCLIPKETSLSESQNPNSFNKKEGSLNS